MFLTVRRREVILVPVLASLLALAVPALGQGLVRLNQADALKAVTAKVDPAYPPIAKQMEVQGAVRLDVTIEESGKVEKVDVLSGNPMLTGAAVDAVKKWKFQVSKRSITLLVFDFKI